MEKADDDTSTITIVDTEAVEYFVSNSKQQTSYSREDGKFTGTYFKEFPPGVSKSGDTLVITGLKPAATSYPGHITYATEGFWVDLSTKHLGADLKMKGEFSVPGYSRGSIPYLVGKLEFHECP